MSRRSRQTDLADRQLGPANALSQTLLTAAMQPGHQTAHSLMRLARYREYRDFYLGEQWIGNPKPGELRLVINYARVFVNKAASYLLAEPVGYNAVPMVEAEGSNVGQRRGRGGAAMASMGAVERPTREGGVGAAPKEGLDEQGRESAREVEEYLSEVAAFNDLAALDLDTVILSGVLGDGAFTVRWDEAARMPRITAVDPSGLDARWRADDHRALLWVRQSYWVAPGELGEEELAALTAANPSVDMYEPLPAEEEWTAREWLVKVGGVVVAGGPNPYGVIPYVIYPNLRVPGEFWGESDLCDLIEMQRELNKRVSIFSRILDVAGNPVAVIEGATEDETASLKLGPNQLWTLPPGSKAEVLDLLKAGGAEAHLRFIELLYRAMHDISEMPRTSFGDSSGQSQARSGVALEIELQPLFHKLARKQALLSSAFVRRAQLALRIARLHGVAIPEASLSCTWPPVLPQDREALVKQEVQLVTAGIHPPTRAMSLLGAADPQPIYALVLKQRKEWIAANAPAVIGDGEPDEGQTRPPAPSEGRVAEVGHGTRGSNSEDTEEEKSQ